MIHAEATKSVKAEVSKVNGTASFQLPGKAATRLKPGTEVPAGAVITTGAGSTVDLFVGRNIGVLRLSANTTLRLVTNKQTSTGSDVVTETAIELQEGEVFGNVNKLSSGSTYEITLPDGTVEVAQSRFQLSHRTLNTLADNAGSGRDAGNGSTVRLISGELHFAHDGTTTELSGASEYTAGGSGTVTPLSPEATQALVQVIQSISGGGSSAADSGTTPSVGFKPRALAAVQPQDVLLSPTTGAGN